MIDSMIHDGLWDEYENFHMGVTGELVAEKYKISRQEQDQFAVESHRRRSDAIKSCFLASRSADGSAAEERPARGGQDRRIAARRYFAGNSSKLKAAFKKDGTVTAGNAPGTNDGAAALVVTSERVAANLARLRWRASWRRPSAASSRNG